MYVTIIEKSTAGRHLANLLIINIWNEVKCREEQQDKYGEHSKSRHLRPFTRHDIELDCGLNTDNQQLIVDSRFRDSLSKSCFEWETGAQTESLNCRTFSFLSNRQTTTISIVRMVDFNTTIKKDELSSQPCYSVWSHYKTMSFRCQIRFPFGYVI